MKSQITTITRRISQVRKTKITRSVSWVTRSFGLIAVVAMLSACSKSEDNGTPPAPPAAPSSPSAPAAAVKAPNTGDPQAEVTTGNVRSGSTTPGQTLTVVPERVRVRTTPDQPVEESRAILDRGDTVQVVDPEIREGDGLIAVDILTTAQPASAQDATASATATSPDAVSTAATKAAPVAASSARAAVAKTTTAKRICKTCGAKPANSAAAPKRRVYIPAKYLQTTPVTKPTIRYFIVQNIATEKLRVYERAESPGEPNTMIFETDMISGENNPGATRRTALGSYKIEQWFKFYQDVNGLFPSWYHPDYPTTPPAGSPIESWISPQVMPMIDGKIQGRVRGAFGWYTAKIGPNAHAQWTHGTLGWGADQDRFIEIAKSTLAQFYSDPRSFGCTRVENRAIAFMQAILPVGTPLIKIYAKESVADAKLERYADKQNRLFNWLLTKDDVRKGGPLNSNEAVQIIHGFSEDSVLDRGTYEIDGHPDAVTFEKTFEVRGGTPTYYTIVHPDANLYDLKKSSFVGEFFVDEGRVKGYKHPSELRIGGYEDQALPGFLYADGKPDVAARAVKPSTVAPKGDVRAKVLPAKTAKK